MNKNIPDLTEYRALIRRLGEAARQETLVRFRNRTQVFNKAGIWFDPVTDADREAERAMRRMVRHVYPRHGILGEEFGEEFGDDFDSTGKKSDWRWVFDPVDGTRAFVCGTSTWMTLIALEYKGDAVLGFLDQPFTDECWMGNGNETIYTRGEKKMVCQTSGVTDLDRACITTTDPRRTDGYFDSSEADAFKRLSRKTRLARFSLDAYGYAMLALGEIDIVVEAGLAHHDYASLAPVVQGAGGVITNWKGKPVGSDERGEVLAAATPKLHEKAMAVLNKQ